MVEHKYDVWEGKVKLASGMTLDNAMLFVQAYFEKYYNEEYLELRIVRHTIRNEL